MALRRKFGGKVYEFHIQTHLWGRANSIADKMRKEGYLARVVEVDILTWEVWIREKK